MKCCSKLVWFHVQKRVVGIVWHSYNYIVVKPTYCLTLFLQNSNSINFVVGMGNNVCQNLVFVSPHWSINSKHVMQCTIVNVDGLTAVKNFLVSLSDAASLAHRHRFTHKMSVLASHSEAIRKNLWSPVTVLLDAHTKGVSADTELLYRHNHFSCLDLCITKN